MESNLIMLKICNKCHLYLKGLHTQYSFKGSMFI